MDVAAIMTQEVLERISRHCPEALSTYLHCVNRADSEGGAFFPKILVDITMSEDWRKFRKHVKALAREDLLKWQPIDDGIYITLDKQT